MNRRDFIGGMAAAVTVGPILKMPLPIGASTRSQLPRAEWLTSGVIDAGGSHEPYIFVIRRGGESLNARKDYESNQSEELIRTLHEQGIEMFHTHLYKGFGMAAEGPEMEDARRVAAIAHRYGMKVDSYIQWNTMMYETFFAEEPRARDWIQRDASGLPIMLVYGYQQSYRYRPCFTHQDYLDYLKKIVRFAVEEVKTDFIHFDNFDLNPEPDSCHCSACVEGFRAFLRAKYSRKSAVSGSALRMSITSILRNGTARIRRRRWPSFSTPPFRSGLISAAKSWRTRYARWQSLRGR